MRIETTDPMSGEDVTDLEPAPFQVEGQGEDAVKVYFESEACRQACFEVEIMRPTRT